MPDPRIRDLEIQFDVQQRYLTDPWAFYPILLRPFPVKILMVTDGIAGFGRADFGLSAVLAALATPPGPWVRFDVTKAHRRFDPAPDSLSGFRFDAHDLSQYDQIWMYAFERAGTEIADEEVKAIAQFMDGGGGVFATGDHEDLGVAMCGRIPRVRSMRRWYWPGPGPNGEPVAPKVDGADRLDTLSAGRDPGVQFDDQSDDVPQTIRPRLYSISPWSRYFHRSRPHPVLCGPRGMIRVLPDHAHEGICEVPADLTATLTFAGYTVQEYPGGLAPEVIATSTEGSRGPTDVKGLLNARSFGAIGAYDGHQVAVGRVVVDSTWHHHFDINLIGELGNTDPVKAVGFDSSPAGHAAYEDIKAYYRNIAVWLARGSAQQQMWWRALWWTRWHHRLGMDLRPPYLGGQVHLDLAELTRVGSEARDALGRLASQCTVYRWIGWELIAHKWPKLWDELRPVLDPWHPTPPRPDPAPDLLNDPVPDVTQDLHAELLIDAVMGAAVYAVATRFPVADEETIKRAEAGGLVDELPELVTEFVRGALREVSVHLAEQGRRASAVARLIATD